MKGETIWKAISIVCISALLGGVVERNIFADDKASGRDMNAVIQRLDTVTNRLNSLSERLSNVEGKLDIALGQRSREARSQHKQ